VEVDSQCVSGRALAERLVRHGILTKETHDNVIRFAPPLVITREELEDALERIRRAFAEEEGALRVRRKRPARESA
jgi:ornithine--oxo-acid transaminase